MASTSEPTTRTLLAEKFNHQPFIPVIDVAGSLLGCNYYQAKSSAARSAISRCPPQRFTEISVVCEL